MVQTSAFLEPPLVNALWLLYLLSASDLAFEYDE